MYLFCFKFVIQLNCDVLLKVSLNYLHNTYILLNHNCLLNAHHFYKWLLFNLYILKTIDPKFITKLLICTLHLINYCNLKLNLNSYLYLLLLFCVNYNKYNLTITWINYYFINWYNISQMDTLPIVRLFTVLLVIMYFINFDICLVLYSLDE